MARSSGNNARAMMDAGRQLSPRKSYWPPGTAATIINQELQLANAVVANAENLKGKQRRRIQSANIRVGNYRVCSVRGKNFARWSVCSHLSTIQALYGRALGIKDQEFLSKQMNIMETVNLGARRAESLKRSILKKYEKYEKYEKSWKAKRSEVK